MKLQIVPPGTGLQWVLQGLRTFKSQPLALAALFFLGMASMSLISALPLIGPCVAVVDARWPGLAPGRREHEALRRFFGLLVEDVLATSRARLAEAAPASARAVRHAIRRAGIDPAKIGAIYIGSESHPYAVKPSGTVVAEAIGATPDIHCADFEFACKAGSEGMFVAMSLVRAGEMEYALGIGADTSQGAPGDALEYSAAAGAAAFSATRSGACWMTCCSAEQMRGKSSPA